MRRLGLVFAALGAASIVLVLSAGRASATTVHCGDVITHDTTLDADLTGCGLLIGASNVTLDLSGHTISADPRDPGSGIEATFHPSPLTLTNVTIENGTIEGFVVGVNDVPFFGSGKLRNLTLVGNANAILATGSSIEISHNDVSGGGWGIICGCYESTITHNKVSAAHGIAAGSILGGRDVISHNAVHGAGFPSDPEAEDGIALFGAPASIISFNTVFGATNDGLFVRQSDGTVIAHNTANDNGNLGIEADPSTVDGGHNRASGNGNPVQCIGVSCSTTGKPKQ